MAGVDPLDYYNTALDLDEFAEQTDGLLTKHINDIDATYTIAKAMGVTQERFVQDLFRYGWLNMAKKYQPFKGLVRSTAGHEEILHPMLAITIYGTRMDNCPPGHTLPMSIVRQVIKDRSNEIGIADVQVSCWSNDSNDMLNPEEVEVLDK